MAKEKRDTRNITILLAAKDPFDDRCGELIDLLEKFIGMVQVTHPEVLEEQKVWVNPESEPGFNALDLYSSAQWAELKRKVLLNPYAFGFRDYDSVRKGRRFQKVNLEFLTTTCPRDGGFRHLSSYGYCLSFSMRRDIYEAVMPLGFHVLLNDLAQTIRAVSGWVDCSLSCANDIMYAEAVRVSSLSLGEWRDQIERLIPGYYWRQLLTEQHIRILGGISKIKREAPCADVEETDIDGKPAVWLRLNDNPYTTTPEERLKLKEYLWPLLPPVNYSALMFEMKDKRVLDLTVLTNDEKRIIDEL